MIDVVALGELLIDFTHTSSDSEGYPTMAAHPGGAPANFLAALASYGASAALIGKVGCDTFGSLLTETTKNVTTIYLTDYVDNNLHASAPYLVKMDNNFVVMWKEYKLLKENGGYSYKENAVKYTVVDENGNKLTDVQTLGSSCNLSDCIPMYYNGNIIWYYEMGEFERHIATLAIG